MFPYQNFPVPRPVSFPVDDLVTTSSIVGDADELADATTSDISIDLDVDATNQQDELDEKHGTVGEDSCSLEELDLLETCSESSFSDEMPDLYFTNPLMMKILLLSLNVRKSSRSRTLSSAAMERMVTKEIDEEKYNVGNLFLLEDNFLFKSKY